MAPGDRRKIDLLILIGLPPLATAISLAVDANYFWAILLFLGLPSLYLSLRSPRHVPKTALFALVASLPAILVIDYIGQTMQQWVIVQSILPLRLFGVTQIEQLLWAFLNFYAVVIFYKHFLDRRRSGEIVGPRWNELLLIDVAFIVPFGLLLTFNQTMLRVPYYYLVFGLLFIGVPAVFELLLRPRLAGKFLKTAAYFFYLSLAFELTALSLDCCWQFASSQYIGWVSILDIRFPLEELLFWMTLFALAILAIYEKFDEDEA